MPTSGSNTITGTAGSEHLNGGSGADIINGIGGNDRINAGSGNDIMDGGSGNDIVNGDAGDDLGIYVLSENIGSTDVYDGGSGRDTLQLVLTRAQWQSPAVQADIARFLTFLAQVTNPVNGQASNANFTFSFGLTVSKFEALQVMVDGVAVDPRDEAVTLVNDVMSAGEETASVSVNVLANDSVPDLIATLTNTQPSHGTVTLTRTAGSGSVADTASFVYTPDAAHWQYLAAGQTATDTFTYTVTDSDGDTNTATVTVTITGSNDGPTLGAVVSSGSVVEDGAVSAAGTIAFADIDLRDAHTASSEAGGSGYLGTFTTTVTDSGAGDGTGSVTWDFSVDNAAIQYLAAGQTLTQTYAVTVDDGQGGTVTQPVTVTITGSNDTPTITAAVSSGAVAEDGVTTATGAIAFADVDLRDGHTVSSTADGSGYLGAFTATVTDDGSNDGAGSVTWNFELDNAAAEYLNSGQSLTQSYTVSVSDGNGGTVSQVVTITIAGNDDNTAPTVNDLTLTGITTGTGPGFPLVFSGYSAGLAVYSFVDSNGDGSVDTPDSSSPLSSSYNYYYNARMAVGDIDGDGDTDVVIGGNGVTTFTNMGDLTGDGADDFVEAQLGYDYTQGVELADLNGDGLLDIVAAPYYNGSFTQFINQGDANNDELANDFTAQTVYSSASYYYSSGISTGDFNADGREDILVASYYSSEILFNQGDTNNDGQVDYTSQILNSYNYDARSTATGDIDGDGDIDFVVSRGWNSETVHINNGVDSNGQISFSTVELYTQGYTEESELVDIDGDGDLDVVSSGYYGDPTIAYNQGDTNDDGLPEFVIQNLYSPYTSYGNRGVAVGDIDGDGDLDIVLPSENGNASYLSNEGDLNDDGQLDFVAVQLNGVGASWDADFTEGSGGSGGGRGVREDGRAVTGLFDGDDADEDDDAGSLTYTITSAPTEGTVINNGDGTFSFSPGSGFQDLAYGETRTVTFTYTATDAHGAVSNTGTVTVNVAGANDRVVAGADTGQALENGPAITGNVLANDSDVDTSDVLSVSGVNGSSQQVGVQVLLSSGAMVVVNADGQYIYDPNGAFEGLAAGETATDTFSYQVTDGNGGHVTQTVTVTIAGSNDAPVVSDVRTGEAGFPLVFSGYSYGGGLAVYSFVDSDNDGYVDTPDSSSSLNSYYTYDSRMVVGDIDGDGDADVVIGGSGVRVFTNVGDTTGDGADDFVQTQLDYNYTPGVALADLNGDGLLDIVTAPYYGYSSQFINQGDANNDELANDFSAQQIYSQSSYYYSSGVSTGDFNGDGREDILIASYNNTEILFNQGDADNDGQIDFTSQAVNSNYYYDTRSTTTGDIDGDGDIDFVVSRGWNSETVYINNGMDGNGQVNFSTVEINAGGYTEESELVDIDGDGDLDIVSSDYYSNTSIAYNQGDANEDGIPDFVVQTVYSPYSYGNRGVAVGDIDGDGDLDIVLPSENGYASYLSNEGDANNDGLVDFVAVQLNGIGSSWDADFTGASAGAREDGPAIMGRFRGDDADSDDDRDSLTYTITSAPSEGSVINNGDGTFTFSPGSDFQDLDQGETREVTFTYTATDSHGVVSSPATVTLTVAGADEPEPSAAPVLAAKDMGPDGIPPVDDKAIPAETGTGDPQVLPGEVADRGPSTGRFTTPDDDSFLTIDQDGSFSFGSLNADDDLFVLSGDLIDQPLVLPGEPDLGRFDFGPLCDLFTARHGEMQLTVTEGGQIPGGEDWFEPTGLHNWL